MILGKGGGVVKTQFLLFFLAGAVSIPAWARFVDPSGLVERAQDVKVQQVEETEEERETPTASRPTLQQRVSAGVERAQTWWRDRQGQEADSTSEVYQRTSSEERGPSPEQIEQVTQSLSEVAPVQVSTPGRQASPDLKRNPAGVPVFEVEMTRQETQPDGSTREVRLRRREIPRLDVGLEPRVSRNQFVIPDLRVAQVRDREARPLPSPSLVNEEEVRRWTEMSLASVGAPRQVQDGRTQIESPVTQASIAAIQMDIKPVEEPSLKEVKPLTENQMRLLAALILYDKGNRCPTVIGLFHDLAKEDASLRQEANYYAGACALRMSLFSEALYRLRPLASQPSSPFYQRALARLMELPEEYAGEVTAVVAQVRDLSILPEAAQGRAYYLMARQQFRDKNYSRSLNFANRVKAGHRDHHRAQYLVALSEYSQKRVDRAISILDELHKTLGRGRSAADRNLQALVTLNLARMLFQKEDYQRAHNLYRSVDKENPLWIQALIEQGWSQLHINDYAGAIGNMYSLHSPYFTAVYKPESFAIRTIGYLNICQYGDAYQTLSLLENQYRPWLPKLDEYLGGRKPSEQAYDTVRRYLQGRSTQDVDGLPYRALREVARQRPFLSLQAHLNTKADQGDRFKGVADQIRAEQERVRVRMARSQERYDQAVALLQRAETDSSLAAQVNQLRGQRRTERDLVVGYRYQLAIYEQGRQGFLRLKENGEQRLAEERRQLRERAGNFVLTDLRRVRGEISDLLDKNEFLRYEVFSGSGENIRFQAAGGQVGAPNRIPASIQPERNLSWSFRGEFWKDEIGAYRSTLRNNCPNVHGISKLGN